MTMILHRCIQNVTEVHCMLCLNNGMTSGHLAKEKVDEKILILFQMKELELEWVKIQGGP